ncbi:hypothetical protein [Serratia sp. N21D137]|uniref:hypothetical protein n=1 Tax=Serratia sp. N21D137 TaxID=3397495 RepID=UPI0039DFFB9B
MTKIITYLMKLINKRIKPSIVVLIFILFMYVLYPFINGLGCNFKFISESPSISLKGVCHLGRFTLVQKEKETGALIKQVFIFASRGDYMYFIKVNSKIMGDYMAKDVYADEVYREQTFRIFYIKKSNIERNTYVFISTKPINLIFRAKIYGEISIF